jgi:aspartyl-tRNA(Asn)/glutamyl-tRNA(Gln) amidotransferase subunit B
VDANVSVRGDGTMTDERTEVKNLNSFAHVEHALAYEIERQRALVAAGGGVATETLLWDTQRRRTRRMRGKEESRDYRYLVDPDLAPLRVAADRMAAIRAAMPELHGAMQARFAAAYDLPGHAIEALTAEPALAEYFEAVAARVPARAASSWILTDVLGWLNRHGSRVENMPVRASALVELITLVEQGKLSRSAARRVFDGMARAGGSVREIVAAEALGQVSDSTRIAEWVEQTIAAFPDEVERYRAGRKNVMSFLIGQVMKLSGGSADPRRSGDLLRDRLDR